MPAPVMILAEQADQLIAHLRPLLPSEQLVAADKLENIADLLEEHRPEVVVFYRDTGFDGPELAAAGHFPSVRWAHVSGSGYEFLLPLESSEVTITNGQGLRSRNLAEMLTGAMIALNNRLLSYRDQQRSRSWNPLTFRPLEGQHLLIVGTGQIGTWVARNAKALGMKVSGINRQGQAKEPFDQVFAFSSLHSILPQADVVSLHLRLAEETDGLFDETLFRAMKPGSLFINTSRGGIVQQDHLAQALQSQHLRGAYLDVFESEPLPSDSPLWEMDQVLITPHAADLIEDWDLKSATFFAENLNRWRRGERLANLVHSPPLHSPEG